MRARGFTLVELSVVLVIIGLIAGALFSMSSALMNVQREETTRAKLKAIDAALVSFVAINKRLPCPAMGYQMTGIEVWVFASQNNPCTTQDGGVVPWATLGLSASDIEDGWGTRITYRLDPYLARTNAMDMSQCDPAGTMLIGAVPTDTPNNPLIYTCVSATCTSLALNQCVTPAQFLTPKLPTTKGVQIRNTVDVGGVILMDPALTPSTGAAYVLISHGENQSGGYGNTGALLAATIAGEGSNETQNRADTTQPYYIDTPQNFSTNATRFDDLVLRPSIISVIQRASLGPRSH